MNALSEWVVAEVRRDGKIHKQSYKLGTPTTDLEIVGECKDTGTTISSVSYTHLDVYKRQF